MDTKVIVAVELELKNVPAPCTEVEIRAAEPYRSIIADIENVGDIKAVSPILIGDRHECIPVSVTVMVETDDRGELEAAVIAAVNRFAPNLAKPRFNT
jgi:hypothetical protein